MKKKCLKNRWGVLFVMLAFTLALVVVASSATAESPQYGGVLKIISRLSTNTLGTPPEGGWGFSRFGRPCYEPMFQNGEDLKPTPWLIENWEVSPDGKRMVFHVKKGVRFHDGDKLDAEQVKWALTHMGGSANYTRNVKEFNVLNEYTLELIMHKFDSNLFLHTAHAAGFVGSKRAFDIPATPEERAKKHMIGTGPFKFVDWERDVFLKYTRNDDYWQEGRPYLDGLEFIWIKDPVTAMAAFKAGEGHMLINLVPKDAHQLKNEGYRVKNCQLGGPILVPDGANPDSPFANQKVREAAEYALDRQAIAEGLGYGFWTAVSQFEEPGGAAFDPNFKGREHDPAKAKALLKEAGYPNGFQTRIIARSDESRDALVAMQGQLAEVGIKAKVEVVDRGKYAEMNLKGWQNGLLWGSAFGSHLDNLDRTWNVKSTRNHSMYRPAGWQEMLDDAISTVNDQERLEKRKAILKVQYDLAMAIPLWTRAEIAAFRDNVQGIDYMKYHPYYYRPDKAWLKK